MSLNHEPVDWKAPAYLKPATRPSNRSFAWVGSDTHYDTVAGVVRRFIALPAHERSTLEMLTEAGVVAGLSATVFPSDALSLLANRADLPLT